VEGINQEINVIKITTFYSEPGRLTPYILVFFVIILLKFLSLKKE
jgi:hypothetical protein